MFYIEKKNFLTEKFFWLDLVVAKKRGLRNAKIKTYVRILRCLQMNRCIFLTRLYFFPTFLGRVMIRNTTICCFFVMFFCPSRISEIVATVWEFIEKIICTTFLIAISLEKEYFFEYRKSNSTLFFYNYHHF